MHAIAALTFAAAALSSTANAWRIDFFWQETCSRTNFDSFDEGKSCKTGGCYWTRDAEKAAIIYDWDDGCNLHLFEKELDCYKGDVAPTRKITKEDAKKNKNFHWDEAGKKACFQKEFEWEALRYTCPDHHED